MCSDLAMDTGPDAAPGAGRVRSRPSSPSPLPLPAAARPRPPSPTASSRSAASPPAPLSSDGDGDDDEISVGCPSPAPSGASLSAPGTTPVRAPPPFTSDEDTRPGDPPASASEDDDDYFKPLKRLKMVRLDRAEAAHQQRLAATTRAPAATHPSSAAAAATAAGVKSFSIVDILNHRPREPAAAPAALRIVRPWDLGSEAAGAASDVTDALGSPCSSGRSSTAGSVTSDCCASPGAPPPVTRRPQQRPQALKGKASTSPLDALFQMTSKTFEELNGEAVSDGQQSHLALFNSRPQAKKKRKSRTAFTNHQIFELEKRFLYQKYLSPADRDEIAGQLGLTNAQVITWFQNRRAKLKRDMEELKKDVESSKLLTAHKSFLENVQDLGILKKKPSPTLPEDKQAAAVAAAAAGAAAGLTAVSVAAADK